MTISWFVFALGVKVDTVRLCQVPAHECVCCCKFDCMTKKKDESSTSIDCITDHEDFQPICLDVWVLQTAYFTDRSKYGNLATEKTAH